LPLLLLIEVHGGVGKPGGVLDPQSSNLVTYLLIKSSEEHGPEGGATGLDATLVQEVFKLGEELKGRLGALGR